MAVPILLVTGFLGAGKTTLINHLLAAPQGLRLAAVVNDFGAINIDAALLGDGVYGLANGCICCTLQGDLIRTLGVILRRDPVPDAIVIETSGVSDPGEIVRALLDPVIFREAALDTVICVADARHLSDRPALLEDALCRAQISAGDFVALNKIDLVTPEEHAALRARLRAHRVIDIRDGAVPASLLFGVGLHRPQTRFASNVFESGFESVSWTSDLPLSLVRFQAAIGALAPTLLRAKGFLVFSDRPAQTMLFQLVGSRATLCAAPPSVPEKVSLVFIGESSRFRGAEIPPLMASCAEQAPHPEK